MLSSITIRDAEIADLPAIVEIYNSTIASRMVTADTSIVSVESKYQWFNEHSPAFRPLWVIEDNKKICGWVSFQSFYGRPAYNSTAEVSIYFSPDARGKGLGKYILKKTIAACPSLQIKTLLGYIFAHNEPSIRLFTTLGFEKWAYLPKIAELDGIERDVVILGKRI